MQHTRQRKFTIICILVSLFLLIGVFLVIPKTESAKAETIASYDSLNFTQITNEDNESSYKVAVKPAYRSQVKFVVIPETYEGLPVTEVAANGFVSCANLTKVILPATVKVIGNNAFMNCAKLQSVGMPNVQSIGTNAFGMCTTLERLFIPDSVTEVGSNILRNNSNKVYVQSSVEVVNQLWSSTWSNYFTGEVVYSVDPEDTIQYREILSTDNTTVIGYEIKEEQYLADIDADVVIYNSVCVDEELGYLPVLNICPEAFLFSQVNSITIRDRNTDDPEAPSFDHKINIRSNAFLFAIVQEINIEVGVTFNHPEGLQMAYTESLFDGQPIAGDANGFSTRVFEESVVKSITLPSEMDLVTDRMFYNCTYLENIKLSGVEYNGTNVLPKVNRIGTEAFSSCVALKNVTVPESVNYVSEAAFSNLGENVDEQAIYVDIYEDEVPEGWDVNWAVNNKDNVKISYKPLTYITVELYDNCNMSIGLKPGRMVPAITEEIAREGYVFDGIYSGNQDGGYQYYNNQKAGSRVWNTGDPETLYARWVPVQYTITYNVDWKGQENPNPTTYTVEDEITFINLEKAGYNFEWFPVGVEAGSIGNLNVKGTWTPIEYTITYDVDLKGQINPNPTTYTVEDEITFIDLAKEGYSFEWDTVKINKGTTGNIIVKGSWTGNDYYITYDVDLKGQSNPNPNRYLVEDEITFTKLAKPGYTFEWFPAKINKGTTGNVTVKGVWTLIEYKITYNVWEGTENTNPTKYDVEHNVTFAPAVYYGYEVTRDKVSTNGCLGDITVSASYKCVDSMIGLYNRETKRYEIKHGGDLDALRMVDTSGKTFYVDVDYKGNVWTAIPMFKGTLMGSVRNIKLIPDSSSTYYGFILDNDGVITDFTLDCTLEVKNTMFPYRYVGAICGINGGKIIRSTVKSSSPISYTMSNGTIIKTGILNALDSYTDVGGLVGDNCGIMENCTNQIDIYCVGDTGGIAANAKGHITNCYNYGAIRYYSTYRVGMCIGGIAGIFFDGTITGCENYGDIWYMNETAYEDNYYEHFYPYIGGIVGMYYEDNASYANLKNHGTIHTGVLTSGQQYYVDDIFGERYSE